jgi:hypothetical protein
MGSGPRTQGVYRLPKGAAQLGQFVIHALRCRGENSPRHQTVSLQSTQREGKHALGNPADHAPELVKAHRAIAEQDNDEHRPLVAYAREHGADGAAILAGGIVLWGGHFGVLRYQVCASLRTIEQVYMLVQVTF